MDTKKLLIVTLALLLFAAKASHATCLKDCNNSQAGNISMSPTLQYQQYQQNQGSQQGDRSKSHDFNGDVKNSVAGDVNIHVGHERVEIGKMENSNNNFIDASINSTVILGDVKQ